VLALEFGATVYSFSLILATFLVGLGLGSAIGDIVARRAARPGIALGWCQLLLPVAMAWAAFLVLQELPYWTVAASVQRDAWLRFETDFGRCLLAALPAALLWGASFPLAAAAAAFGAQTTEPGRLVGRVYAANTVGAIVGSLGTSVLIAAGAGTQRTQQALILVSAVSGALLFISERPLASAGNLRQRTKVVPVIALALIAIVLLVLSVTPVPGVVIAYGRQSAAWAVETRDVYGGRILYAAEGLDASVAVSRGPDGTLAYHAAGKVQASGKPEDMRLQLLLAHLSHLVPQHPARVLVIGCGAGITTGAIALSPSVEHVTVAEIESIVPDVARTYFADLNYRALDSPKVTVEIDDGRHFLWTSHETFDVITTDMIDPWVRGIATLFTTEFFQAAKAHLRPGGIVTQFVQLYQSSPETVKSEIATFAEVFPDAIIWGNPTRGQGYDLVLMGQADPSPIDVDELDGRLKSPSHARVAESLRSIGIESSIDLLSTYAGNAADLGPWLHDAAINRDRNLRLEYLAGLSVDRDDSALIYRDMLRYARFPAGRFVGSAGSMDRLRQAIARPAEPSAIER
jgi:spermidine synthase